MKASSFFLEIGNPYLKMVVFQSAMGTSSLRRLSVIKAGDLPDESVAKTITGFLSETGVRRPTTVSVAFSRSAITLRTLRIPSTDAAEIDNMIKLHVGRQVPYAKEEIVSGYRIFGKDSMGYAKVMLAIVHRESIRKTMRILEKAGLFADKIELGSDGVFSWLCRAVPPGSLKTGTAFLLLDVDAAFTDLMIATQENVVFSRVVSLGREALSDPARWGKFFGEMKQTMVISQTEDVAQKPGKIYVCGAIDGLKEFTSQLSLEFNLPVEVVEPLANMPLTKDFLRTPTDIFSLVSVSSILGQGVDAFKNRVRFILPEAQIRRSIKERGRRMIFFGASAMYLILVLTGIYFEKFFNKQSYLAMLTQRYEKITAPSRDLDQKVDRIKRIKNKLDLRNSILMYLQEVSRILPVDIQMVSVTFQKGQSMVIKGRVLEMPQVFKFIGALEDSPYFKDIQTRYTTRKKIRDLEFNEFELVCPLEGTRTDKKTASRKGPDTKEPL